MNEETYSTVRNREHLLLFKAVLCGSDRNAFDAKWPKQGGSKDRKPSKREKAEDEFAVLVESRDAKDKMQDADGHGEGKEKGDIVNELAVANRCG
jgi:hypothetical protein